MLLLLLPDRCCVRFSRLLSLFSLLRWAFITAAAAPFTNFSSSESKFLHVERNSWSDDQLRKDASIPSKWTITSCLYLQLAESFYDVLKKSKHLTLLLLQKPKVLDKQSTNKQFFIKVKSQEEVNKSHVISMIRFKMTHIWSIWHKNLNIVVKCPQK